MKSLWRAALVAVAATGFARQSPVDRAPVDRLVVIVDSDSPVADEGRSARLRQLALEDIEQHEPPVYYDLTAASIARVPEEAADSFRTAAFAYHPANVEGITLGFDEASEILRKNESVRDAVIRRECAVTPDPACQASVHVAAGRVMADTEAATGVKLRRLVETATERRPRVVVLITAGWPYRDQKLAELDRAARGLRALGTTLIVVRLPARLAYRGLVKDASEQIAAQVSAPFIALGDDRDIPRLHGALGGAHHTDAPGSPDLFATEARPGQPVEDARPAVDRHDAVFSRAVAYVTRFERTLSSVIWREQYQQDDRVRRRFNASGTTFSQLIARRHVDAELLFVWLPRDASWIAVRDVVAVDGRRRAAGERRLQAVLAGQTVSVDQLRELAEENGRFNIGQIVRTFNEPTLALLFLDDHYRPRFTFAAAGERIVNDRRARVYDFVERGRPTVIQDRHRDVPAHGTVTVEIETGRVLQTRLALDDPAGDLRGRMDVEYGPHPAFDVFVPLKMTETYAALSGEEVTAVATYSQFRRFETAGRLIVPK